MRALPQVGGFAPQWLYHPVCLRSWNKHTLLAWKLANQKSAYRTAYWPYKVDNDSPGLQPNTCACHPPTLRPCNSSQHWAPFRAWSLLLRGISYRRATVRIFPGISRVSWLVLASWQRERLTNPLATPVFDDPPPPPTKTCLFVSICTLNRGKLMRANTSSIFLRCGAISTGQFTNYTVKTAGNFQTSTSITSKVDKLIKQDSIEVITWLGVDWDC